MKIIIFLFIYILDQRDRVCTRLTCRPKAEKQNVYYFMSDIIGINFVYQLYLSRYVKNSMTVYVTVENVSKLNINVIFLFINYWRWRNVSSGSLNKIQWLKLCYYPVQRKTYYYKPIVSRYYIFYTFYVICFKLFYNVYLC